MNGTSERFVPHEHQCYICGKLEGCTDKACEQPRTPWVCDRKTCEALARTGVVHLSGANHRVPLSCCGVLPSETPRQDRMVGDPAGVTCPMYLKKLRAAAGELTEAV